MTCYNCLIFILVGVIIQNINGEKLEDAFRGPPDNAFKYGFSVGYMKALHVLEKRLSEASNGASDRLMQFLEMSKKEYGTNGNSQSGQLPSMLSNPNPTQAMKGMQQQMIPSTNQFGASNSQMPPSQPFGMNPAFGNNRPTNSYEVTSPSSHGMPPDSFGQYSAESNMYSQQHPYSNYQTGSAQSYQQHQVFIPGSFEAGQVYYEDSSHKPSKGNAPIGSIGPVAPISPDIPNAPTTPTAPKAPNASNSQNVYFANGQYHVKGVDSTSPDIIF